MKLENRNVEFLVGNCGMDIETRGWKPYSDRVCDFLNSLSQELLSDTEAKTYPDIISFAFWCRKGNIMKLKEDYAEKHIRLGLGLVFHIAPSNVPINFAFSYAFSLLAGNANIVRVSSKNFTQTEILSRVMKKLFSESKFQDMENRTAFIKYDQNDEITRFFSKDANARIIWGGDNTIRNIRKLPILDRGIEVAFADRYSFCVLGVESILNGCDKDLQKLANGFYNDTYLMDQNACSSPHLIVWSGESDRLIDAKNRFWSFVYEEARNKYDLEPVNAMDKFTQLCENAIDSDNISSITQNGNYIYRIGLSSLPKDIHRLRGKCGYFYEYYTKDINFITHIINNKYQTLTYFGIDKAILCDFIVTNGLSGIDRIVPVGSSLDISVIWDGYDLIRLLSRIIDVK